MSGKYLVRKSCVNRAYVLIDTEDDRTGEVVSNLRCRPGITLADVINGPYRAIAVVESQDVSAMAKTILMDIRRLSGVKDIIVYMTQPGDGGTRQIPVTGVSEKDG